MTYNQALLCARSGYIIMLPGWEGYFYWNYSTNDFNFKNKNYHLDSKELLDKNIVNRKDFYYII